MDDDGSGMGSYEFGVVIWVLVFLIAWWGLAMFFWRYWWPRRRHKLRSRRRREYEAEARREAESKSET